MKYIMNKYPIIEDVMVAELKDYLAVSQFEERFPNFGMPRVSNDHPFATLLSHEGGGEEFFPEIFPSVTVVSGTDAKPSDLANAVNWETTKLTAEDLSAIAPGGFSIGAPDMQRLAEYFETTA